jgi:O-antigen ligase
MLSIFRFDAMLPALPIFAVMCGSYMVNGAENKNAAVIIYGAALAILAMPIAATLQPKTVLSAFHWAARVNPLIIAVLALIGANRNVTGVICVIFAGVSISQRRWGLVAIYGAMILLLGGRGAMLAFMAQLIIGYALPKIYWVSVGAAGVLLTAIRPETIQTRLLVWRAAISLFWQHPLLGGGPGSMIQAGRVFARQQESMLHAHNIVLQALAEGGVFGLVALGISGVWIYRLWPGFGQWQRLIIIGVLITGIMDYPFMMPGMMILFAMAIGATGTNENNSDGD